MDIELSEVHGGITDLWANLVDERALQEIDVLTHIPDDLALADISEFLIDALPEEVDENLANVDWDQLDWDNVAADFTLDELKNNSVCESTNDGDRAIINKRRRMNEEERLRKYSWERHPIEGQGSKRPRYKYVNTDGSIVKSLRDALRKCGK